MSYRPWSHFLVVGTLEPILPVLSTCVDDRGFTIGPDIWPFLTRYSEFNGTVNINDSVNFKKWSLIKTMVRDISLNPILTLPDHCSQMLTLTQRVKWARTVCAWRTNPRIESEERYTAYALIKKKITFSSYCMREIQSGAFAKYEEMGKYFPIYEEAVSHIWLCNCSTLNFLIYEENLIFFFISVRRVRWMTLCAICGIAASRRSIVMLKSVNIKKKSTSAKSRVMVPYIKDQRKAEEAYQLPLHL